MAALAATTAVCGAVCGALCMRTATASRATIAEDADEPSRGPSDAVEVEAEREAGGPAER